MLHGFLFWRISFLCTLEMSVLLPLGPLERDWTRTGFSGGYLPLFLEKSQVVTVLCVT